MQSDLIWSIYDVNDALIVVLIGHKIKAIGVNQQNAHAILLLTQKVEIALLDVLQIRVADFLLIAAPTLANVALEACHIGIKVNQQLRLGHVGKDDVKKARKPLVFVLLQIVARENQRLGHVIVRDDKVVEQVECT